MATKIKTFEDFITKFEPIVDKLNQKQVDRLLDLLYEKQDDLNGFIMNSEPRVNNETEDIEEEREKLKPTNWNQWEDYYSDMYQKNQDVMNAEYKKPVDNYKPYKPYNNWYTKPTKALFSKITKNQIKKNDLPVFDLTFSSYAYAQILVMMEAYPSIEWGAHFVIDEFPSIDTLIEHTEERFNLRVNRLIIYPQTTSVVDVNFDPSYTQYMNEYTEAMNNKENPNGIIHSHHNMFCGHSPTDMTMIKERIEMGQKVLSLVFVNNKNKAVKLNDKVFNTDSLVSLIDLTDFDYKLYYPNHSKIHTKSELGFYFDIDITYFETVLEEHIELSESFLDSYQQMIEGVKILEPIMKNLDTLLSDKIIEERDYWTYYNGINDKSTRDIMINLTEKLFKSHNTNNQDTKLLNAIKELISKK